MPGTFRRFPTPCQTSATMPATLAPTLPTCQTGLFPWELEGFLEIGVTWDALPAMPACWEEHAFLAPTPTPTFPRNRHMDTVVLPNTACHACHPMHLPCLPCLYGCIFPSFGFCSDFPEERLHYLQ